MAKMRLYAVAGVCQKGITIHTIPMLIAATNQDEATGLAYKAMAYRFPAAEGYNNHNLNVFDSTYFSDDGGKTYSKKEDETP